MKLYSYFRYTQKTRLEYFSHSKEAHYRNKASERYINWVLCGAIKRGGSARMKTGEHYWMLDQTLHSLQGQKCIGKGTEISV